MPSVLPLLGVSLLPAVLVLAMVCSLAEPRRGSSSPAHRHAAPAARGPRKAYDFSATVPARHRDPGRRTDRWRRPGCGVAARERAALRLLGFEPGQATVVVRADPDVPTDKVQRLIETAQEAGFAQCVLRPAELSPASNDAQGIKP